MSTETTKNAEALPVTFQRASQAMRNLRGFVNIKPAEPIRIEMRKNEAKTDWELVVSISAGYQDMRRWPHDVQGVRIIVEHEPLSQPS